MTAGHTECRACDGEGGSEGNVLSWERETGAPICEWLVCDNCGGRGEVRVPLTAEQRAEVAARRANGTPFPEIDDHVPF